MNKTAKFLTAAGILAAGMSLGAAEAEAKEKCYGVVKAGKNDCGAKDGSHSCAGQAKTDADPNEWIFVPDGLCEKLAGGTKG